MNKNLEIIFRPKPGAKECLEIFLEGEKWRDAHRSIMGRKPFFSASQENIEAQFDLFEYGRVKKYVLWRLSTQSYHSQQLAKLLRDRFVQEKTIEKVLQEMCEIGFLDDELWLQNFRRLYQKRYSLRVLLSKLQSKGISSETVRSLAEEWKDPQEELQSIQYLLKTRYRSKNLSHYPERQKVMASLIRKGYSFEDIKIAMQNL